ncbi:MAG: ADP-forming succinate--CoA ligase subunit beta [Thermodesulfobacteriota bacterium]|nr:ADP-forming succinate--CoA ligase subunit beta [Thermodesulfobacteriota bacterium]
MKIHEYQAKALFQRYNIPTPSGGVAQSPEEAKKAAQGLEASRFAVKAQIHAGGRGKGGGVKVVNSLEEVSNAAQNMLGQPLVTPQTGPEGQVVRQVLVEAATAIKHEYYVGLTLDRNLAMPVFMVSTAGGMDIEEVAEKTPELIFKEAVDTRLGMLPFQSRGLAQKLGWEGKALRSGAAILSNLYKLFVSLDASLVEINPLVLTEEGGLLAIDAKMNFDDNALFRHPDIREMEDPNEIDPLELEAGKYNLNYIRLDGNIGAMVNGAGLAMATMDLIKQAGAEPANFLDVGGSANAEMIANGFRIILSDERVKAILINIFGGILRCDVLAQGVVDAASKEKVEAPIIIRLEGTNVDEGRRILNESSLTFSVAKDLKEAAEKVAAVVRN